MNRENVNILENLRSSSSIDAFKKDFISLLEEDPKEAIGYLNENSLRFPTLFLLIPEIEAYELRSKLNWRNKLSIKICHIIQTDKQVGKISKLASDKNIIHVLEWMFETGTIEDGLHNDFDQVLDSVTALLIIHYGNHTILPTVANMIFIRNQRGLFLHDLVWSFFESHNPTALQLVSNYFKSENTQDVEFAYRLLNFDPSGFHVQTVHPTARHKAYRDWLDENDPYLYFTGESFQLTSEPIPCKVNIDAKYLHKQVSPKNGKTNKPLTRVEKRYLQEFQQLQPCDQEMLSRYSCKIYKDNIRTWKKWIDYDIHNQIESAKHDMEGY